MKDVRVKSRKQCDVFAWKVYVVLFMLLSVFVGVVGGNTFAATTTYREQGFWDVFWGNGLYMTYQLYTVDSTYVSALRYENERTLVDCEVKKGVTNSVVKEYEETIKRGHELSGSLKVPLEYVEINIGGALSCETTTSNKTVVTIAPGRRMTIKEYDRNVGYYFVHTEKQTQIKPNGQYVDYGSPESANAKIYIYDGNYMVITEGAAQS